MRIEELIKYLNDMMLLYGNKVILTVTERDYANNVIAWQENPEPYKAESEG
jgi:hypothetical protein